MALPCRGRGIRIVPTEPGDQAPDRNPFLGRECVDRRYSDANGECFSRPDGCVVFVAHRCHAQRTHEPRMPNDVAEQEIIDFQLPGQPAGALPESGDGTVGSQELIPSSDREDVQVVSVRSRIGVHRKHLGTTSGAAIRRYEPIGLPHHPCESNVIQCGTSRLGDDPSGDRWPIPRGMRTWVAVHRHPVVITRQPVAPPARPTGQDEAIELAATKEPGVRLCPSDSCDLHPQGDWT